MNENIQLSSEEEKVASAAFTAFLAGRMKRIGNILAKLSPEQRVRVYQYGLQPKIQALRDDLMLECRSLLLRERL